MNLKELQKRNPAKHAQWKQAEQALEDARAQVRPANHACGELWAEVERAQAAYQAKRDEAVALEREVRLEEKAKKVAALAREVQGL